MRLSGEHPCVATMRSLASSGERYAMWHSQLKSKCGHAELSGVVVPFATSFRLPSGHEARFPYDPKSGFQWVQDNGEPCSCCITAPPRSRVIEEDKKRGINTAEADAKAMFGAK